MEEEEEERGGHAAAKRPVSDVVDSAQSATTSSGNGAARLSGIAKMLSGKGKGKGAGTVPKNGNQESTKDSNGLADDDLPLGSEANSLPDGTANGLDSKRGDGRPMWNRTASQAAMMGWQSFNSDVSNQTTGSSASLEMLLNERQVDPEMMLLSLGFGGQAPEYVPTMARVPARFLKQPSQAQGVATPWLGQQDGDAVDSGQDGEEENIGGSRSPVAAAAAVQQPKRKPGMWTLARTLSLLKGGKMSAPSRMNALSPLGSPGGGTPPGSQGQGQHRSILIPANQQALANRGFYTQHGWPAGIFEEEKPVPEDLSDPDDASKNAASKRKMFQKTRSRRNWSLCGSGEDEDKKARTSSSSDWVTKSMDDSLSREDSGTADDTLGRLAYFSTTTESSTDSLDGKSSETERALEEIRRQYNESQNQSQPARRERSSSEDLFIPDRNAQERLSELCAGGNGAKRGDGIPVNEGDFLVARSNNYFVSPASSRQATVEKAPSVCDTSSTGAGLNSGASNHDDNNNTSEIEENLTKQERSRVHFSNGDESPQVARLKDGGPSTSAPASFDQSNQPNDDVPGNLNNANVRIIVSGSRDSTGNELWFHQNSSTDSPSAAASHLAVKEAVQRASSDSGSSSSGGTAVGSASVVTVVDDLDTLRMSESESSVTERDSISRTNSPSGFLLAASAAHAKARGEAKQEMVSIGCQATEQDLAEAGDLVDGEDGSAQAGNANASSVINVKVMRKNNGGTEFVLQGKEAGPKGEAAEPAKGSRIKREMQLSPLPAVINPLELMKRLRRSQEDLARMESIQSDSSGFGDAELGVDSAAVEADLVKDQQVASLGSSLSGESSGTLTRSNGTTEFALSRTEEMATQTAMDAPLTETVYKQDQSLHSKSESMPSGIDSENAQERQRYITTCFIPTLVADNKTRRQFHKGASLCDLGKEEDFVLEQQRIITDRRSTSPNLLSYVTEIKYNVQDGYPDRSRLVEDPSYNDRPSGPSAGRFRGKRRFMSYSGTPLVRPTSVPFYDDYSYGSQGHLSHPRSNHHQFLSQSELQYGSQSFQGPGQDVSPTRNDIPLSQELANAKGPANLSSSLSAKPSPAGIPTTSTPASVSEEEMKRSNVSSLNMYINPIENESLSTHSLPPRYKFEMGYSNQPLAGNLSGMGRSNTRTTSSVSRPDQYSETDGGHYRSCDILEEHDDLDFEDEAYPAGFSARNPSLVFEEHSMNQSPHKLKGKRFSSPAIAGSFRPDVQPFISPNPRHSIASAASGSRLMDDTEAYSSVGESSSEFSVQSSPEGYLRSGTLDAQKLARLINKPVYIRGKQRSVSHYRPRRHFREWHVLNRKKRLQEENRLLQHSIQKYKDELNAIEESFVLDYQVVYDDLTDEERDEIDELEWLWDEVKLQVTEMEGLIMSRIKSVHSGNDFHSLLSSLGVVNKTIELLKEQMYQHQVSRKRIEHPEDEYESSDHFDHGSLRTSPQERSTFLPSHSFMDDTFHRMHHPRRSFSHHAHSASTSSLPAVFNVSLDQIKSSLLKEMKEEIKASTQKLEGDLKAKEKEIQALRQQLESEKTQKEQASSSNAKPPAAPNRRSWEPKTESRGLRRSRSRILGDRLVTETDV